MKRIEDDIQVLNETYIGGVYSSYDMAKAYVDGQKNVLENLESKKPSEELEEEIHKYNKERFDEYFPEQDGDFISEVDFMTCLDRVACHFAKWGAEHAKK